MSSIYWFWQVIKDWFKFFFIIAFLLACVSYIAWMMLSQYWSWQAIKDYFEFFLVLAALCACGYIAWNQLIYLYLMLIFGGIAAGLAPIASQLYNIPPELIGIAPSLSKLLEISRDKVEQLSYIEEAELQNATQQFVEAKNIIFHYAQKHPNLINEYPELREIYELTNRGQQSAEEILEQKLYQRQIREEQQRQQRQEREEQQRREAEQYWQRIEKERAKKGLKRGVPPETKCTCPFRYPIRATENLNDGNRGIYYYPGEREGVEVAWCFENPEDAEAENFRRPYNTPPRYQP